MTYNVAYLGEYVLDRRYTQSMLPWVMDTVRRREAGLMVQLVVDAQTLRAELMCPSFSSSSSSRVSVFEHVLETVTRFTRTPHDPKCFSYLVRHPPRSSLSPPSSDQLFVCHVFHADDEHTVSVIIDCILYTLGRQQANIQDKTTHLM